MSIETDFQKQEQNALEILGRCKNLVWPEIQGYLKDPPYPAPFEIPNKYKADIRYNWKIVREYPERQGKYLRPTLVILATEAMGFDTKKAIKTATAMQVSEDWLLIHDDLEDHSELRRGKPTLHRLYGPELAVNAGDFLHIIMWRILLDNREVLGEKKAAQIIDEFYRMLVRTTHGQGVEIAWAKTTKPDFSDKDWFFIADGKTAYYTIAGPLRLGALIAEASSRQINLLAQFGLKLGRCFQLVDDLLDITTEYRGPGQRIGSDIYESKKTLILGHLLRAASARDRKKITSILAKDSKTDHEVTWILEKMSQYKSIDYARKVAANLKEEALLIFERNLGFLSSEPARTHLKELISFILERRY